MGKIKQVPKKMHIDFIILAKSLFTGFVAGVIFSLLNLPIPAPSQFSSIVGILGIFLGLLAVRFFVH